MSKPLKVTGPQKEILREGIVGAYPDPDNLWILLAVRMEVQVSAIARGDAYKNKVFNLIQDFETDGRIEEFIRVVVKDKPRSPALEDVKKEFASILGEDSPKEITYDHPIKQNQERKPTQNNKSLVPKMHILHLSDLHFGTPDQAQIWSNQLVQDLRNELNIASLDALILSGDIANKSTESEYKAARKFLDYFRQDFHLEPEQIIIVPGNHDLNWEKSEEAYTPVNRKYYQGSTILLNGEKRADSNHAIDDGGRFIEQQDEDEYKERFFYFSQFYQSIKGTPYPKDYEEQYTIAPFPSKKLLILGLNSAWQLDHHYKERASINMNALSNALTEIRRNSEYGNFLKIAVWHHPLDSAGNDRITDQGFMELLAVDGFRLFLHGHVHEAQTSLYRYDTSANGRKLDRICAGTFGAPTRELVPAYPWQYNLLKFEADQLIVETRRREKENGAWKPDARWSQGAGQDPLPRYTIALPEYALEPIKK
jgi:3',5'-cyclic AMP phosphodiesterase CpdA